MSCGTITEGQVFVSSSSQRESRKSMALKNIWRNNRWKLPKCSKTQWILNKLNTMKSIPRMKYLNDKTTWKQPGKNAALPIGKQRFGWHHISHQKPWRGKKKKVEYYSKNCKARTKKLSPQNLLKINFWNEFKVKIFSEEGKLREFVDSRFALKEFTFHLH